jgi:hypothetical protein
MRLTMRAATLLVASVLLLAASAGQATANPWGQVDCDQHPDHADCRAQAATPGDAAGAAGPGGEVVCRDDTGEVVDCFIEGQGWIGADGCRYLFNGSDSPPEGVAEPGGWYVRQCSATPGGGVVWLADADAPGPALLAQVAMSRLRLPPPEVELSPPASVPQLVMLPIWLWVTPQWWVNRSASASVTGLTVTAVATPVEVLWDTGDGASHTCGAGTPYAAAADPASPSPDCGHTYTRTSAGQPGAVFTLTATVTWQVTWSGGGASGSAGLLFSTATVPVQVVESLSRNTSSSGHTRMHAVTSSRSRSWL